MEINYGAHQLPEGKDSKDSLFPDEKKPFYDRMQQVVVIVMMWYVYEGKDKDMHDEIVIGYNGGGVINEDGFVLAVAWATSVGQNKVLVKLSKDIDGTKIALVDSYISRNLAIYKPNGNKSQDEESTNYCQFLDINSSVREGM